MRRLLVVIPNWVGDVVLATPVLAALRAQFRAARIGYLMRRNLAELVAGGGWHDQEYYWPQQRGLRREVRTFELAGRLRGEGFDAALLLTNSFRAALVARLGRIPRRIGYARDARDRLLTDRLRPLRQNGEFVPSPLLDAYVRLAERVGCRVLDRRLRLGLTPQQERAGRRLLEQYGLHAGRPYAVINPGAAFGAAKRWPAERFAELCDRLPRELELTPVIVGAPNEAALMRRIAELARSRPVCCDDPPTTLGSLKVLVREAKLLVCNDTGPRHYGNAFDVPTVTIFGPTDPAWTDTGYAREIIVREPVECGPCQLRTCPLDHRCMTRIPVERVLQAAREVLGVASTAGAPV